MLLLHQTGSVKVGEVVRYTLTYDPSADRILPPPSHLHLRIKNTSNVALRAAYLHGPYAIHVAAYPAHFHPNQKLENPKQRGQPQFEPNLKAGSHFNAKLTVPDDIRVNTTDNPVSAAPPKDTKGRTVTWIIEVTSQIIFSSSAKIHFEVLVSRDERSLDYAFHAVQGHMREPGKVEDHQESKRKPGGDVSGSAAKGVYSKAVKLMVHDTTALWDTPKLPQWEGKGERRHRHSMSGRRRESLDLRPERSRTKKKKKIHLVILTHGLHSNLNADMLYMKESIDATVRQAREARKKRRKAGNGDPSQGAHTGGSAPAPLSGGQEEIEDHGAEDDEDSDDEQVIVRGFGGNSGKTENGIQYLGKRMARFVLELTYPDQPFLPLKKSMSKKISESLLPSKSSSSKDGGEAEQLEDTAPPAHSHSTIHKAPRNRDDLAYTFTSISFIGHSLGGLIQLYAIAYIQKHAPHFFDQIKPVNFVAMATPLLGLSNENPIYVKFALDFGLVGRTGQDLGLTWRAPTLAKSGWTAMVSGFGGEKDHGHEDPGAKPLLRILPTGPAHRVLRMFRNRTLYSNVVNDGIVPLRTSCLLFLDWSGLERVEKARRENGLIGTMVGWGYNELTGQNMSPNRSRMDMDEDENNLDSVLSQSSDHKQTDVPQPTEDAVADDDDAASTKMPAHSQFPHKPRRGSEASNKSFLDEVWSWIRPSGKTTKTDLKMFQRSQTLGVMSDDSLAYDDESNSGIKDRDGSRGASPVRNTRPQASRGNSTFEDASNAPPKTTIFESAGDILNPPIPPQSWINDPGSRARTIFHDRVYHPEDIPPPPPARKSTRFGSSPSRNGSQDRTNNEPSTSGLRIEEKIARAYHRDLSWRKVLVRLEPDAHNNMIVRRMFANAYGWPVVKHLCDTHFADTHAANTRDEHEPATDRAKGVENPVNQNGEKVRGQESRSSPTAQDHEMRENPDELGPLQGEDGDERRPVISGSNGLSAEPEDIIRRGSRGSAFSLPRTNTTTSMTSEWDEQYFRDSDSGEDSGGPLQRFLNPSTGKGKQAQGTSPSSAENEDRRKAPSTQAEIADFLTHKPPRQQQHAPSLVEGHRGLAPSLAPPLAVVDPANTAGDGPGSPKRNTALAVGVRSGDVDGASAAAPTLSQVTQHTGADAERGPMRFGSGGKHISDVDMDDAKNSHQESTGALD